MDIGPPTGTPWLHKEGSWFLIEKSRCGPDMQGYTHDSLIWHECQHPKCKNWYTSGQDFEGVWRLQSSSLDSPCPVCEEVCPPEIQALWRFHNWETMDMISYSHHTFYGRMPSVSRNAPFYCGSNVSS